MGKPIIMGRNTHASIGRPLPGRRNIVITRQSAFEAEGCDVVFSIDEALALCKDTEEAMIMGGASLYEQTLPLVDTLYLTRVHAQVEGDTWFPAWSEEDWQLVSQEDHQADDKNEYDYSFLKFERVTTS
jgi:dihydrofolate reductase